MDSLIPIFNKIQDVFSITGSSGLAILQFPQIVVVGSQSSGKSSVLESLVQRSFLPKGTGVATRCPIVLQLIQLTEEDEQDYCVFLHSPDEKFTDFDVVREEIEKQTDRIAGNNKGIVREAISLKIHSKDVFNLTLVDLPGLVKNPIGDQPEDIEDQIKDLVIEYIENPNSIILAVSPANMDIATSESLKYAKQVDPEGSRTLAVITKLDLMSQGTDAVDVLSGLVLPVKLGIIGVMNRSQQDVLDNKPFSEKITEEEAYLARKYPTLAAQNGIPYLAKSLNRLLMNHICSCLPDVEKRMKTLMKENKAILMKWKNDDYQESERLIKILAEFSKIYCAAVIGKSEFVCTNKLAGGARINDAFKENLKVDMNAILPNADVSDETITLAIKNSKGIQSKLFIPEEAFETLVKKQILRLEDPALECAANVAKSLEDIINDCFADPNIKPYMERYTVLKNNISSVVRNVVAEGLSEGERILKEHVEIKSSYICTSRPEFYDEIKKMMRGDKDSPDEIKDFDLEKRFNGLFVTGNSLDMSITEEEQANKLTEVVSEEDQCRIVRKLVDYYFTIIKKDFRDYIPQALVKAMVKPLTENLQSILLGKLYDKKDKVMQESQTVATQLKSASNMIKALDKATQLVAEVRETSI